MIWTEIVDKTIIAPFKVDAGVKLNSANYCDFLDKNSFVLYDFLSHRFTVTNVFIHDNATVYL